MNNPGEGSRTLVTGAAGFVGAHLVRALVSRGDRVVATDVVDIVEGADVSCARLDITDARAVERAVEGMDAVFHVASVVHTRKNNRDRVFEVNHAGTKHLLDACRKAKVRRFVYVSSASVVYEGRDIENGDETLPYGRGQAPYADSKIEAEKDVLAANREDFRTCAIRPHVVFGPGDGRFLPNILARAAAGRLTRRVGRELKLSDFTYIDNLIDGLLRADESLASDGAAAGQAYFVTNGEPVAFWDFVDKVLVATGRPPTRGAVPYALAYGFAALAETWHTIRGGGIGVESGVSRFAIRYMCTHHYFSIQKARRDLGYEPRVNIDEGIRRTVAAL